MRSSRSRSWRLAPSPTSAPASQSPARILGLDPGSIVTGFGIVDCGAGPTRYVASGSIRTTTGRDFAGRLHEIFTEVQALMREYRPAEVVIERVFVNRNPDSAIKLGQARGAALCGAMGAGISVFEYTPAEIKRAVTGTGAAEKAQVQHMVKALLALDGRLGADAADALAVALCHAAQRSPLAALRRQAAR